MSDNKDDKLVNEINELFHTLHKKEDEYRTMFGPILDPNKRDNVYQQEFRRIKQAVQLELAANRSKLHGCGEFYLSQFYLGGVAALEKIIQVINEPEESE